MIAQQHFLDIQKQIEAIEAFSFQLQQAIEINQKISILDRIPAVYKFLSSFSHFARKIAQLSENEQFLIKTVLALGQGPVIFNGIELLNDNDEFLAKLLQKLHDIEQFYDVIGGILGYHLTVLKLICSKKNPSPDTSSDSVSYYEPEGLDISNDTSLTRQAVRWGIEHMSEVAEIYPLGGAGDRLHLKDETNKHLLPVAQLLFSGRTLLEGLIRDLYGREFLYYKLFCKQITAPLAVMTSHEKDNHRRIIDLCEEKEWFGRPKDKFAFFVQPLVPVIAEDGLWVVQAPLQPVFKPGGHGVIWKVASDKGIFKWLKETNSKKAVVRQINNPVAGVDNGLLALQGIGCHKDKKFGFASCFRLLNMPEGMDVLCEKKTNQEYEYCITNIEYTEFEHRGIQDLPEKPNSPYSRFPSNTNILFIDLNTIEKLSKKYPTPGLLINMKTSFNSLNPDGSSTPKIAGRLESTMQNIADYIVNRYPKPLQKGEEDCLSTFITYNKRSKTISVTKQAYETGKDIVGTPEGCYYDLLQNYSDLLTNYCGIQLPPEHDPHEYMVNGPAYIVDFHPALGVLYGVIAQKIRGGHLSKGAEWVMEIAEADIENLYLQGSLLIEADDVMGKKAGNGSIVFDHLQCGKCTLINVSIRNKGILHSPKNIYWKRQVDRLESLHITLHGNGEFFAKDVVFEGNIHIDVPDGHRIHAYKEGDRIVYQSSKIPQSTWKWNYSFDDQNRITIKREDIVS